MFLEQHISNAIKHSVAYSFAFSQPFSFYVDAYPIMSKEMMEQAAYLEYGSQHESVRTLQHKLQQLSYYDSSIDGNYGILTEYALKKFQEANGLEMTGRVNEQTIQQLITIEEEMLHLLEEDNMPSKQENEWEEIQKSLQYFGYYEGNLDGIYGPQTEKAIESFKNDRGLEAVHIEAPPPEPPVVEQAELPVEITVHSESSTEEVKEQEKEVVKEVVANTDAVSQNASTITTIATKYIGSPYVWGGTSTSGFDCSGYLQYVFKEVNISLPRTVNDIWNVTKPVDKPSIGDLVFFETYKRGPSHAGIYLGNNQFIHAGTSGGVQISSLDGSYWKQRYLGAKRVVLE